MGYKMVDLSELKVGDKVKFRNGSTSLVDGFSVQDCDCVFPCEITFEGGGILTYTKDGFYLYDRFNDNDIMEIIPQSESLEQTSESVVEEASEETKNSCSVTYEIPEKKAVDLHKLLVGDKVKFRDGSNAKVHDLYVINYDYNFPYLVIFENGDKVAYTKNGFYCPDEGTHDCDIIEIIPQGKEESDRLKVDLHNIAEGDSVYCDDGSEHVVDNVTFDQNYAVITFYDFGTFEFNYDGSKFQEDAEVGNIIDVLHGAPESKEPIQTVDQADPVNHPSHYTSGGIECIEAIKASMMPEAYRGFLKGNVMKYLWRYENKGKPVEDLKKAQTYLTWLIKENGE